MTNAVLPPSFAPGTPSARFSIRLHTDSRDSDLNDIIMHGISQKLAQCAPLSGYEENTQQACSVTLLAPDA